jgi:hypothetical protein
MTLADVHHTGIPYTFLVGGMVASGRGMASSSQTRRQEPWLWCGLWAGCEPKASEADADAPPEERGFQYRIEGAHRVGHPVRVQGGHASTLGWRHACPSPHVGRPLSTDTRFLYGTASASHAQGFVPLPDWCCARVLALPPPAGPASGPSRPRTRRASCPRLLSSLAAR